MHLDRDIGYNGNGDVSTGGGGGERVSIKIRVQSEQNASNMTDHFPSLPNVKVIDYFSL